MTYDQLFRQPMRPGLLYAWSAMGPVPEPHFKFGCTSDPNDKRRMANYTKARRGLWRFSPLISFLDPDAWRKERAVHTALAPFRAQDPDYPDQYNPRINWEIYRIEPDEGLRRVQDILAEYDRRLAEQPDQLFPLAA